MQKEQTKKEICANCFYSGNVDEDGLCECKFYPPVLKKIGERVCEMRPRVSPSDYCALIRLKV